MSKYSKKEYVPYVPNYKKMNITPTPQDCSVDFSNSSIPSFEEDLDNPRTRKPNITTSTNIPYSEFVEVSSKTEYVPNVGNNIEHTWVGIDGEIVDDLGINGDSVKKSLEHQEYNAVTEDYTDTVKNTYNTTNIGEYLIIFNGQIISTGDLSSVQNDVRSLIFGEHELCKTNNINVEDLIVLKRIPIKIGVFIE
jgi:hypothetical protein